MCGGDKFARLFLTESHLLACQLQGGTRFDGARLGCRQVLFDTGGGSFFVIERVQRGGTAGTRRIETCLGTLLRGFGVDQAGLDVGQASRGRLQRRFGVGMSLLQRLLASVQF